MFGLAPATWDLVLKIVEAVAAVLTLFGAFFNWVVTHWRKRNDEIWSERLRSNFQGATELRLRMHDRSWQLLREWIAASWEVREALVDCAIAIRFRRQPSLVDAHERCAAALAKVHGLGVIFPSGHSAKDAIEAFRTACNAAGSLIFDFERNDRDVLAGGMTEAADEGLQHAYKLAREWNAQLWSAADALVAKIDAPKS